MKQDNKDQINPAHYKKGGLETWDILEAKLDSSELTGFCKGNIIKYITRVGEKGEELEQYKKAHWYLTKLIKKTATEPIKTKPINIES
jgi:hypothetical protein